MTQRELVSESKARFLVCQGIWYNLSKVFRRHVIEMIIISRKNEEQRKADEVKAQADEKVKEEQRKKIYDEAQKRQSERVGTIMHKQSEKDKALASLQKTRDHEADLKSLQYQLELESKRDKASSSSIYNSILFDKLSVFSRSRALVKLLNRFENVIISMDSKA